MTAGAVVPIAQVSEAPIAPASTADGTDLRLDDELMIYQVGDVWSSLEQIFARMRDSGCFADLRLDCHALREFDGAGLQLLWLAARQLDAGGAALRLCGLSPSLREQLGALDPERLFFFDEATTE